MTSIATSLFKIPSNLVHVLVTVYGVAKGDDKKKARLIKALLAQKIPQEINYYFVFFTTSPYSF